MSYPLEIKLVSFEWIYKLNTRLDGLVEGIKFDSCFDIFHKMYGLE